MADHPHPPRDMTPLERCEALHAELTAHYHEASDAQLRAAAKLLLVAIEVFRRHGGPGWPALIDEYVQIAAADPARFARILAAGRGECAPPPPASPSAGEFIP